LHTDHNELKVSDQQALDLLPRLSSIYCEPFSDVSQIPTFLVAQMAKKAVTVCISGDAGDELFGGYQRYFLVPPVWRRASSVPAWLRNLTAATLTKIPTSTFDSAYSVAGRFLPPRLQQVQVGERVHKFANLLGSESPEDLHQKLLSKLPVGIVTQFAHQHNVVMGASKSEMVDAMMKHDFLSYLPEDILVKVDRAAMSNSLETRVPFLDSRVIEFAWSLPEKHLIQNGQGKQILRSLLYKRVPAALLDRPKMGFSLPIGAWLRGPLREWAEDLLKENDLRQMEYINTKAVRDLWQAHLAGRVNHQYALWTLLMLRSWQKTWNH
jgi:asparagine synthase (glutamine-hydrolysing)